MKLLIYEFLLGIFEKDQTSFTIIILAAFYLTYGFLMLYSVVYFILVEKQKPEYAAFFSKKSTWLGGYLLWSFLIPNRILVNNKLSTYVKHMFLFSSLMSFYVNLPQLTILCGAFLYLNIQSFLFGFFYDKFEWARLLIERLFFPHFTSSEVRLTIHLFMGNPFTVAYTHLRTTVAWGAINYAVWSKIGEQKRLVDDSTERKLRLFNDLNRQNGVPPMSVQEMYDLQRKITEEETKRNLYLGFPEHVRTFLNEAIKKYGES